jgi:hypothetical protein
MNNYMRNNPLWKGLPTLPHIKDMNFSIAEILVGSESCMELNDWPQAAKGQEVLIEKDP